MFLLILFTKINQETKKKKNKRYSFLFLNTNMLSSFQKGNFGILHYTCIETMTQEQWYLFLLILFSKIYVLAALGLLAA